MKSVRHSTLQSLPFHYSSILVITFPLLLETCHYASVLYLTLPFLHETVPHSSIAIRYFIPLHASFALHGRSVHHSAFPSRNRTTLLHSKTIQFFTTPLHYFIALHSSFAIRGRPSHHPSFALHGRSVHHSASPSLYYGNSLPHSAILLLHLTAHNFTWPSLDLNSPFFCIIMLNINLER